MRKTQPFKISYAAPNPVLAAHFWGRAAEMNAVFYPADAELDGLDDDAKAELALTVEEAIKADDVLVEYDAPDEPEEPEEEEEEED